MRMKDSEVHRLIMEHQKMYRDYENADPELLAHWDYEDRRNNFMLECILREEARAEASLDDFNVNFKSEVKIR